MGDKAIRTFRQICRVFWVVTVFAVILSPRSGLAAQKASIIIEAGNGAILQGEAIDTAVYPASLVKMMTLYLTFESLKERKLFPGTRLEVSALAARQSPSRIGLRKGETITVQESILALVTKSANDAAVVLAEAQAESERDFAVRMTAKAKNLGMAKTQFRNASGLYHREQVSTARDLALLANALIRDFPQYAPFFSVKEFRFHGRIYRNHNDFLKDYPGADGIKTGYLRASGYNLAASVSRGERRLIGIVLGEESAKERKRRMTALFDKGFGTAAALERSWEIQVGEASRLTTAHLVASSAARRVPDLLHRASLTISPIRRGYNVVYRARFLGIREDLARVACDNLKQNGIACDVVSPFEAKLAAHVWTNS